MNTPPARILLLPTRHSPDHNHLLAALPAEIFERISPHPELISMPLGEVLYEFNRLLCDVRNRQELPSASHG